MARNTKKTGATPIDTVKHKDKQVNIPTEELRDFVKEDEAKPKTILYPRDPSLAPQLVWKGKDEQDSQDLAVLAVPVYIQEKINPQAIIDHFDELNAVEVDKVSIKRRCLRRHCQKEMGLFPVAYIVLVCHYGCTQREKSHEKAESRS